MERTVPPQGKIREGRLRLAIIGGGFSGIMTVVQLLRMRPTLAMDITLIEQRTGIAEGVAYSTTCPLHLLNVTADKMSAFEDDPDNFLQFAQDTSAPVGPKDFAPRLLYSAYLKHLFAAAMKNMDRHTLTQLNTQALRIVMAGDNRSASIELKDGNKIEADRIVLAIGNLAPSRPISLKERNGAPSSFLADAWSGDWAIAGKNDSVFLIGSGLTAIDKILELIHAGHTGQISMISRHGLMPQPHSNQVSTQTLEFREMELPLNVVKFVTTVRQLVAQSQNWRQTVDSLRVPCQRWWQLLPVIEQRRFLRHAQAYWDVHRHRMAPQIHQRICQLLKSGQLVRYKGTVVALLEENGKAKVEFRRRGEQSRQSVLVDNVINCSGYYLNLRNCTDPLLSQLLSSKLAVPNDLGVGLKVAPNWAVLDGANSPSKVLYTLGTTLRGQLFESVAVPELRKQARDLAKTLITSLSIATNLAANAD
jgi:uncharacterized NAD(P)/FAD-binding protein YdhS